MKGSTYSPSSALRDKATSLQWPAGAGIDVICDPWDLTLQGTEADNKFSVELTEEPLITTDI